MPIVVWHPRRCRCQMLRSTPFSAALLRLENVLDGSGRWMEGVGLPPIVVHDANS
jgi:hypothetical protein